MRNDLILDLSRDSKQFVMFTRMNYLIYFPTICVIVFYWWIQFRVTRIKVRGVRSMIQELHSDLPESLKPTIEILGTVGPTMQVLSSDYSLYLTYNKNLQMISIFYIITVRLWCS